MPVISVIVPVYRVEQYLKRCVDSILHQTYTNFELILVNDGSPDGSGAICEEYALKDSRVHVMHKENGGQASARNMALDWVFANSSSQWIHFVDSDDYIHPQMLERLLRAAEKTETKISVCRHIRTEGEAFPEQSDENGAEIKTSRAYYMQRVDEASGPCAKLIKKELFREVRFPCGKVYEDAFTMYKLFFQCETIADVDWIGYAYFNNNGSTIRRPWGFWRLDLLEVIEEQINFFESRGDNELKKFMIREYFKEIIWQFAEIDLLTDKKTQANAIKNLRKIGREAVRVYWKDKSYRDKEQTHIYACIYPRMTRAFGLMNAVLKKITKSRC